MSSPGQGASGGAGENPKENPRGLRKFMRRASLVLKRDKSKRQSISDTSTFAPVRENVAPAAPSSTPLNFNPTEVPTIAMAGAAAPPSVPAGITQTIRDNKPISTPIKPRSTMNAKENATFQEEKARALFAKYGLTLEPGEWRIPVIPGVPRVEKKVRMRVHRICHRCQTPFGSERVCINCDHNRCKKCPGLPSSKQKAPKGKGFAAGIIAVDDGSKESTRAVTMPNRATGNQLERKTPTQRVRRNCHECGTLFAGKAVQCGNCNHMRCSQCPRDPPKKEKYPEGYPGDTEPTSPLVQRELRPTGMEIRWNCEKCETTFKDHGKTCGNCGHEKCDNCPRQRPQKVKRPLDEDAVKSVEERMRNLDVSPQASAA